MSQFEWNEKKNEQLKQDRAISFEQIVYAIERGHVVDIIPHPNTARYHNQSIYAVSIDNYVYLVPFVRREDGTHFLKTIIPSRKATRDYLQRDKQ